MAIVVVQQFFSVILPPDNSRPLAVMAFCKGAAMMKRKSVAMFNSRGFFSSIPTVTKNLLIINILMWVATLALGGKVDFDKYLGLHYWEASDFNVAQFITYMFMHANFSHLFFNMFSLFMFGIILERALGPGRYLFYYISCGIGAALVQEVVWTFTWIDVLKLGDQNGFVALQGQEALNYLLQYNVPELERFFNIFVTIGASGAVFGLLLAFAMLFPNMPMYLFFIPIPIKAKWMVIGYGLLELAFGVTGAQSTVAHFAHLGGMLFGFFIIWYWKKKGVVGGGFY